MPRALIMGEKAIVTSAHPLASQAGIEVLAAGGNAVDAAIATNAALGVVRPGTCGPGGDLFALVFEPTDGQVHFINGSGRAPAGATLEAYAALGLETIPARSALAITVPGCVDAWHHLHRRFGKARWHDLFERAISLATEGFPLHGSIHRALSALAQRTAEMPAAWLDTYARHLPDQPGSLYRTPNLGRALVAIAQDGRDAFYTGEIAQAIAATVQEAGGLLSMEDLAEHRTSEEPPIAAEYGGHTVYQTPPNTQGVTTLIALQIYELLRQRIGTQNGDVTAQRIHLQLAAYLEGLPIRDEHVADLKAMQVDTGSLIDPEACRRLAEAIDLTKPAIPVAGPPDRGDTTALAVADGEGRVVVLIQSLYAAMGSRVTVPGWGIVLQNRGAGFVLTPGHPNCIAPRKRPLHTLNASLVVRSGKPVIGFATEGGHMQPQVHLQVLTQMIDEGHDIQVAIEAPRWIYDAHSQTIRLEGRFPASVAASLTDIGYRVRVEAEHSGMGQAHGVQVLPSGVLAGGADPRSEGYVLWL